MKTKKFGFWFLEVANTILFLWVAVNATYVFLLTQDIFFTVILILAALNLFLVSFFRSRDDRKRWWALIVALIIGTATTLIHFTYVGSVGMFLPLPFVAILSRRRQDPGIS